MNIYRYELDKLKAGIARAMPARFVSGSLIDHAKLRREELLKGVITVMLERIKGGSDWDCMLQVLITGQIEIEPPRNKDTMGALVEAAEVELFSELRAYLRNTGGLPHIEVADVEFSAHSKAPYGWFVLRAKYGPINEACTDWHLGGDTSNLYPPNVLLTALDGADIKIDIEPHESDAVHQKWLSGGRTAEQPEATLTVETENGRNQG